MSVGQQFLWLGLHTLIGYVTFGCKNWCPKVAYTSGEFCDLYDMTSCKYINIYASKLVNRILRLSELGYCVACRQYFTKLCDSEFTTYSTTGFSLS